MCADKYVPDTVVIDEHPLVADTRDHLHALMMEQAYLVYKVEHGCFTMDQHDEACGRAMELSMLIEDAKRMYAEAQEIANED